MPLSKTVGFRFHPTEEELLNHYLKKKIYGGNDSGINQIIPEIDLCKYEPAELPALLGTETDDHDLEWFFFTRKDYKYSNSSRSNRSTKKGYWKITGQEREIKARGSKAVIGKKRNLTYYHGRVPKSKKSNWVIHEYYLPGNEVVSYQKQDQGDFVICRLKNKSDKKDLSNMENEEAHENDESPFHQTNDTNDVCDELQSPFEDNDEDHETMYAQLRDPAEETLDSIFSPHQPQDHCNYIQQSSTYTTGNVPHPFQRQDYQPSMSQSPTYTEQGNVPVANLYYGECNNWQSAFKRNIEPAYYPFQPQDSTPQPMMYTVHGDGRHNTECNELQYSFGDYNSSVTNLWNTSTADQGYCFSD